MQLGIGPDGPIQGRRVAVTGLGAVSCCGVGVDALWQGLLHPSVVGGEARDFDPEQWFGPKEVRQVDRFAQFSVASATMAFEDAGELDVDPAKAGVIFATGVGGFETLADQVGVYIERGARRVSPRLVPMMMANAGAAGISMRLGWRGPSEVICTACAAGTHSVAAAARLVATGRCEVAIGGGSEASIQPGGHGRLREHDGALDQRPLHALRHPSGRLRHDRGCGRARARGLGPCRGPGRHHLRRDRGGASTSDAHHITAPAPDGSGAVACMELALADAGITTADVGHINAHGTSTPLNDLAEARAINKVFGEPGPLVTSTKGVTGHGLGAAGAIEAVAAVLTIHHATIPPTAGYEEPDPEINLRIVHGEPLAWEPIGRALELLRLRRPQRLPGPAASWLSPTA